MQCAHGLHALHSAGIIHRDLRAANVLVRSDGGSAWFVVLADFGLSYQLSSHARDARLATVVGVQGSTVTGDHAQGPLAWMAPEVLEGKSTASSCARLFRIRCQAVTASFFTADCDGRL